MQSWLWQTEKCKRLLLTQMTSLLPLLREQFVVACLIKDLWPCLFFGAEDWQRAMQSGSIFEHTAITCSGSSEVYRELEGKPTCTHTSLHKDFLRSRHENNTTFKPFSQPIDFSLGGCLIKLNVWKWHERQAQWQAFSTWPSDYQTAHCSF